MASVRVRPARLADEPAIRDLLAPAVAAGEVLPRAVVAGDFLVAEDPDGIVGAVALTAWTDRVVELGSLVAARKGRGLGARLVQAALDEAARLGFQEVVALTALDKWFARRGFVVEPVAPWSLARSTPVLVQPPLEDSPVLEATAAKARRSCARCPRLARCQQVLMRQPAPAVDHRHLRVA